MAGISHYYDFSRIRSYGARYLMIVGSRGTGKTYGAKKIAIANAIKKGEQFIYLRRHRVEQKGRFTFFDDIAHEFPGYEFAVHGNDAVMRLEGGDKEEKWQTIGYFCTLSISQAQKSVAYPFVTTVIFDEFIIENPQIRYLDDEVRVFNNFYLTVDRYKDKTTVFMLSNSASIMNPYMLKWKIWPTSEFVKGGDGFIVCHFADDTQFKNDVARTRFGKFVMETDEEYASYAIDNQFKDNTDDFIGKKSGRAEYYCTVRTKNGCFSVWMDLPMVTVQTYRPKKEVIYCIDVKSLREGDIYVKPNDRIMQILRNKWRRGLMIFDSPKSRNTFTEVFK